MLWRINWDSQIKLQAFIPDVDIAGPFCFLVQVMHFHLFHLTIFREIIPYDGQYRWIIEI